MRRYDNYLDTGNEWLPKVPQHWQAVKLKYCGLINPSSRNYDFERTSDDLVVFLPMEKVSEDGQITQDSRREIQQVITGFTYFERNDILVAKITPCFENGKGALLKDLETNFGFGSTEFHVLRPTERIAKEFLFYITRTDLFKRNGEALMTGSAGQKRVPQNFIEQLLIGLPPLQEQTEIANYLDEKTAQIDTLIEKKQKLIELLKEEQKAITNEAVSGEGKNWERKKLKYLGIIKYGLGQPPRQLQNGLPLIRATNIDGGRVVEKDLIFVDPDDIPYDRDPVLRENDIIVVRSGAYTADSAIIPKKFEGSITGYDMVVRIMNANPRYVAYCLLSDDVLIGQLYLHRLRAAQPHLNKEELGETLINLPSIREQNDIVENIVNQTEKIDAVISKIYREIDLMQEYKTALISEVVTGKVKVI
ncbi:restriction endonuclease subunit S [Ohtaekwangia sp.]|uniref:restriction endonuclease subunit S n=1 Tax=Ohtaekwangia sp. TaxID=2066019 RepID=UPI002FDC87BD